MQLVEVVWNDAWADHDNFSTIHGITQSHDPLVVHTLGWLLVDDEKGLSVANERSSEDDGKDTYRGRTFIPRAMIKSVTPFNLAKPRKSKKSSGEHHLSQDPEVHT
jgi:hypothetical protein